MKVHFTQSGGFAGTIKQCDLDASRLPPAEGAQLEQLVEQSGISASREELSESGRDLEQYEITIDDGQRTVSVVFDTTTVPSAVKPLVGYLKKCARPGP